MGGMAPEANALGNARDMLILCPCGTWAGAQEGLGFHNAKALDTRFYRSESRISCGTSSMTMAFAQPLDWKGSVVAVLLPTA